jgi:hypothetical protein
MYSNADPRRRHGNLQAALRQGHGKKDKGGMILVYEDLLGVRVREEQATDATG